MANDLTIYVDGKYLGRAGASACQTALHTDEAVYTYEEALRRFSCFRPLADLSARVHDGEAAVPRTVQVLDENRY
jgi:hypothetical protein